jgi:hypothetical protein
MCNKKNLFFLIFKNVSGELDFYLKYRSKFIPFRRVDIVKNIEIEDDNGKK